MGETYIQNQIELLKARKNDENYLEEVNALNKQITLIKNDQKLTSLKSRLSDDPFIEELPAKLFGQNKLNSLLEKMSDFKSFQSLKKATLDNKRAKSKKVLIFAGLNLLSLCAICFTVIILNALSNKKSKKVE